MPGPQSGERQQRPIQYRDGQRRVWYISEVARLKVVPPSIDGPNLALVIRFESEGEQRFARWIGGEDWHSRAALDRLFTESERVGSVERPPLPAPAEPNDDTGVGPAPPETVTLWVNLVATMGPDELADFEERTFRQWDRASLFDLRRAIERRRRELGS
jgi:hypothetical protein